ACARLSQRGQVPARARRGGKGGRAAEADADDRRALYARHRRVAGRDAGEDAVLERVQGAGRVVGRPPALLKFLAAAVPVVVWFFVAPHLPYIGHAWNVALVSVAVLPGTLFLGLLALPLGDGRPRSRSAS